MPGMATKAVVEGEPTGHFCSWQHTLTVTKKIVRISPPLNKYWQDTVLAGFVHVQAARGRVDLAGPPVQARFWRSTSKPQPLGAGGSGLHGRWDVPWPSLVQLLGRAGVSSCSYQIIITGAIWTIWAPILQCTREPPSQLATTTLVGRKE